VSISHTETERLIIRELAHTDVAARAQLTREAFDPAHEDARSEQWMQWTVRSYREFASLYQPPYGDYAIVLKPTGELIGEVGLVPSTIPWGVFEQPPHLLVSPEFGLFWAVLTAHRGKGYAAEAAQVIIDHAFKKLNAARIVATTEHTNLASQRVMQKLGMTLRKNPGDTPFWFEIIGVLDNPGVSKAR